MFSSATWSRGLNVLASLRNIQLFSKAVAAELGPTEYHSIQPSVPGTVDEVIPPPKTAGTFHAGSQNFMFEKSQQVLNCMPEPVKRKFTALFSKLPTNSDLTLLVVLQKAEFDTSIWSFDSASERESFTKNFNSQAQEICSVLAGEGYWCDFVDPSSGKPFHGPCTNETFTECDQEFQELSSNLQLQDIGCCRALEHAEWGFHVLVGVLVSNAPSDTLWKLAKSS